MKFCVWLQAAEKKDDDKPEPKKSTRGKAADKKEDKKVRLLPTAVLVLAVCLKSLQQFSSIHCVRQRSARPC